MRTQAIYIEDQRTWGDTGPLTDKLNISEPISAIDVLIRATNGSTTNLANPLNVDVDRVEIIDGTDRLHSLSLVQGIAQNFYEYGRYPNHILTEGNDEVQQEGYRISFGRYLGDPDYWLDPSMFSNLMYRFTGDLTISATVGFATGTRDVTLIAHTMPDHSGSRAGFFMSKEMKQFTSAVSGEDRTVLPDDFPFRMLGVRAFETAIGFDVDITNLKLSQGKDAFVHFDISATHFMDLMEQWRGVAELRINLLRANAATPQLYVARNRGVTYNALNADDMVAGHQTETVDQVTLVLLEFSTPATATVEATATDIVAHVRGGMPHFAGMWAFGDLNDPTQWLSGDALKNLELVLTQGGVGAAVSIWAQQVRP